MEAAEENLNLCKAWMSLAYSNMVNVGLSAGFPLQLVRTAALALCVDAMAADDPIVSVNEKIVRKMRETRLDSTFANNKKIPPLD